MGGRQCAATAKMKGSEASGGAESAAGGTNSATAGANPLDSVAQAGKNIGSSVGHLVGGLFHKKKAGDSPDATAGDAGAAGQSPAGGGPGTSATAPAAVDPFAQYVQMGAFTMETVTINTDAVPATRFDVPPEWTKETVKPTKGSDDYTCPKT
jgi:hypothetical protein